MREEETKRDKLLTNCEFINFGEKLTASNLRNDFCNSFFYQKQRFSDVQNWAPEMNFEKKNKVESALKEPHLLND